ncbi:MAG: class I SAM-dependent methyltransferase [Phycisphaerales bacterium]|nr:MAG: class I SAM-dependent methyltransferase [Phycisphaerales bacterium]
MSAVSNNPPGAPGASALDRYDLYELAAQSPEVQVRFLRAVHAGAPRTLGEDFCGSGAIARAWVALGPDYTAVCVDRDPEAVAALRARADTATLPRLTLRIIDVHEAHDRVDLLIALNFPVGYFHERDALVAWMRHARARCNPGGALVVDIYGGEHAFVCGEQSQDLDAGVRYTWEQREADPATGLVVNAMRFDLPDGRSIPDAFVYRWRLWSIPELRDAMRDAGFAHTDVYDSLGDAVDDDGGVHARPLAPGEPLDDDYVVYVVGRA